MQSDKEAVMQNDTSEVVSLLMETGILIGRDFNLFLFKVIEKSNHRILKILIDHGVQYKQAIDFKSLLNAAILHGNPQTIGVILPYCRFSKSSDQYIPEELVIATDAEHKDCVELLLKWNFTINPNSRNDKNFVYAAVENGYSEIVLQLLKHGIDVNMTNSETGLNLLTIACLNKHHGVVEKLLEHNADVSGRISSMNESLNKNSCFKHHTSGFNELFFHYDYRYTLIDVTCLHIAVFNSDSMMIEILFKHGVKILDNLKLFNLTSYAVYNNYEEIVRIFLDHGVNVENTDRKRNSLLYFCIHWGHSERDYCYNVAKLLLEKGANIHLKTPKNDLVYNAIFRGYHKTTRLFLDYDKETIVMLIAQVVKLKVAGLKVHQRNLDILYDSDNGILTPKKDFNIKDGPFDVEQVEVECQREIEKMKNHSIGIDNFTIYDFLTNHVHLLRVRSKIQTIQRKVDREIFSKKFPLYTDIIKSQIREAAVRCRRNQLMDSARNCFRLNINQRLPDECIDMIWDYLNIGELEMFIQTIKTLEVTQPLKSSDVTQHQRRSTRKRKLTSFKNI